MPTATRKGEADLAATQARFRNGSIWDVTLGPMNEAVLPRVVQVAHSLKLELHQFKVRGPAPSSKAYLRR
jgi:hypothetical protein